MLAYAAIRNSRVWLFAWMCMCAKRCHLNDKKSYKQMPFGDCTYVSACRSFCALRQPHWRTPERLSTHCFWLLKNSGWFRCRRWCARVSLFVCVQFRSANKTVMRADVCSLPPTKQNTKMFHTAPMPKTIAPGQAINNWNSFAIIMDNDLEGGPNRSG